MAEADDIEPESKILLPTAKEQLEMLRRETAAEKAATERAKTNSAKNLEIKKNEQYNGSVSYSLKDKYWRTDLNKTQFIALEESLRQIDNHESKRW